MKLKRKLYVPGRECRRNLPEQRTGQAADRIAEVGVIKSVEELRSELQSDGFPYPEILHCREIELLERRPGQCIPRKVPQCTECRNLEGILVNPMIAVLLEA